MKLIHFSDTHLGFNKFTAFLHVSTRLCNSKLHFYAIYFPYSRPILLEYFLFSFLTILKIFDEVFGSQDENRKMEIFEAFHTIKEQYRQIFLISHEMEIKEMFERVVEL